MRNGSAAARAMIEGVGTRTAEPHATTEAPSRSHFGQGLRANADRDVAPSRIDANVPAGVHDQTMNAVAPFVGGHMLPTGQQINVSMNAPSPHLPFREWVLRGVVAGAGNAAAWPFRMVAGLVDHAARTIINLLGKLVMFVLLPAALILGIQMARKMAHAGSVEAGAAEMMHDSRHAMHGAAKGVSDDLPAETPDPDEAPPARPHRHHAQ